MGGYGSGRQGGRVTSEGTQSIVLDVHWLLRKRLLQSNETVHGWLKIGDILDAKISATLYETAGSLQITGEAETWSDDRFEINQTISLVASPGTFGGSRWWFRCPRTYRRIAKLYLPNGATSFASRRAYRLAYQCQRETVLDRAARRVRKLNRAIGGDGGDECPIKPKWMRWATYNRRYQEWEDADIAADALFAYRIRRLLKMPMG